MNSFSSRSLIKSLSNFLDWKTKRRIVVIESDDWGSIRMPSIESFRRLEKLGHNLRGGDAERYNLYDNLATGKDLESLFEVLSSVKDSRGMHAVFTPVSIVANPDFQKIEDSDYEEYFYEPFTETLKRTPGCENSYDLWKEGIERNVFVPQMHGREHLNVISWMKSLQAREKETMAGFEARAWGYIPHNSPAVDFLAAFRLADPEDLEYHKGVLREGLLLFEDLFGYKAEFFVPPNGVFNNSLNQTLAENGIKYRYVSKIQNEPRSSGKTRMKLHYHGQKDKNDVRYIVRNCFFEPTQVGKDWVDSCLSDIDSAFQWKKPAIIGSHRLNFIGALYPENRESGLTLLSRLLKEIQRKWPDVEFMTTAELGAIMSKE